MSVISNLIEVSKFVNLHAEEEDVIAEMKNKAILMVASCLEGRKESANDHVVHGKLADTMEAGMLSMVRHVTLCVFYSFYSYVWYAQHGASCNVM